MDNRDSKWRQTHGEDMWSAKLTVEKVIEIRKAAEAGEQQKSIAARYLVSTSTIHMIVSGKSWRSVPR